MISGAALYSAIKAAKVERLRQYFEEVAKASEQYLLDNGKFVPQSTIATAYTSDLVTNRESLSTWNGPYIDGSRQADTVMRDDITRLIDPAADMALSLQKKINMDC